MNIYCDSSLTEACVVIAGQEPMIRPHHREVTVNEGEYLALSWALDTVSTMWSKEVTIYTDSQLVARQVNGEYKCRHPYLKILLDSARSRVDWLETVEGRKISIVWVPREVNLAGIALEKRKNK